MTFAAGHRSRIPAEGRSSEMAQNTAKRHNSAQWALLGMFDPLPTPPPGWQHRPCQNLTVWLALDGATKSSHSRQPSEIPERWPQNV